MFKYDETYAMVNENNAQLIVYYTIEKISRGMGYNTIGYDYYNNDSGGKYDIELKSIELIIADQEIELLPILSEKQQNYIIEKILNNGI